jgi:hypothetical protein
VKADVADGSGASFWPIRAMSASHPIPTAKRTSLDVGEMPAADMVRDKSFAYSGKEAQILASGA